MPAFAFVETDVADPERYKQGKPASPAAIAPGGGSLLVRGGDLVVLEGDWCPPFIVGLEFEGLETARRWYESEVYQEVRKLREGAGDFRAVAVQGVD
jgi:uncharacterized protein (DUF1330 family)